MVWIKWGIGSYMMGENVEYSSEWAAGGKILVYSSAFFLNFILTGVRGKLLNYIVAVARGKREY